MIINLEFCDLYKEGKTPQLKLANAKSDRTMAAAFCIESQDLGTAPNNPSSAELG
jgi:hypothetical protein